MYEKEGGVRSRRQYLCGYETHFDEDTTIARGAIIPSSYIMENDVNIGDPTASTAHLFCPADQTPAPASASWSLHPWHALVQASLPTPQTIHVYASLKVCSARLAKLQHQCLLVGPCINCPDGKSIVCRLLVVVVLTLALQQTLTVLLLYNRVPIVFACVCASCPVFLPLSPLSFHSHHAPISTVLATVLRAMMVVWQLVLDVSFPTVTVPLLPLPPSRCRCRSTPTMHLYHARRCFSRD